MKIYVWENDAMMSRSIHHLSVHPPNHPSVHPPIIHLTHEEGYMSHQLIAGPTWTQKQLN